MDEKFIRFKTSSPCGDILSIMPGIKQMVADVGKKAVLYIRTGMVGVGGEFTIHPYQNEQGEPICMNDYSFDMLKPLLVAQDYIEDVIIYDGQEVDFDLDVIRLKIFTGQPGGSINRWVFHACPQMATDLSKKWLEVPCATSERNILCNYTQRYRNYYMTYHFLKPHQDRIMFVGLKNEHELFCKEWGLDIPLLEVSNFYQLAMYINGCKFFMGNASMCFQIAEGLKVPRILEKFPVMPNVIPVGEHAYDAYHQDEMELYFNKLVKV